MCILGSREQYCVDKEVSKSSNKNEDCKAKLKDHKCGFYHNALKLQASSELGPAGQLAVHDIEDIVALGKSKGIRGCPYFASRALAESAEIIFCPYNYLIDPLIRDAMDIDLKGAAVIFDEAHNIEDVCRQAASTEVSQEDLEESVKHWERYHEQAEFTQQDVQFQILESTTLAISQWVKKECGRLSKWDGGEQRSMRTGREAAHVFETQMYLNKDGISSLLTLIGKAQKIIDDPPKGKMPPPAKAVNLLKTLLVKLQLLFDHLSDYRLVLTRRTIPGQGPGSRPRLETRLCLWCLNPGVAFAALRTQARSIILTSGTLSPMASFASELETPFASQLSAGHVVNVKSQVWVGCIGTGPAPHAQSLEGTFRNHEQAGYQDALGESIERVCQTVPHGVLCFFPSYSLQDKLIQRWRITGLLARLSALKELVREPRQGGDGEFEGAMSTYYAAVQRSKAATRGGGKGGGLFFAVCRGKVSEGLDFADENARAVVVIGIPYPNARDQQVVLKKAYNSERSNAMGLLSGSEWYRQQAFRALNQAVKVRHTLYMFTARASLNSERWIIHLSEKGASCTFTFHSNRSCPHPPTALNVSGGEYIETCGLCLAVASSAAHHCYFFFFFLSQVGRCIRHIHDFGAIILLDQRYVGDGDVRASLSRWVREAVSDHSNLESALDSLDSFFKRLSESPPGLLQPMTASGVEHQASTGKQPRPHSSRMGTVTSTGLAPIFNLVGNGHKKQGTGAGASMAEVSGMGGGGPGRVGGAGDIGRGQVGVDRMAMKVLDMLDNNGDGRKELAKGGWGKGSGGKPWRGQDAGQEKKKGGKQAGGKWTASGWVSSKEAVGGGKVSMGRGKGKAGDRSAASGGKVQEMVEERVAKVFEVVDVGGRDARKEEGGEVGGGNVYGKEAEARCDERAWDLTKEARETELERARDREREKKAENEDIGRGGRREEVGKKMIHVDGSSDSKLSPATPMRCALNTSLLPSVSTVVSPSFGDSRMNVDEECGRSETTREVVKTGRGAGRGGAFASFGAEKVVGNDDDDDFVTEKPRKVKKQRKTI